MYSPPADLTDGEAATVVRQFYVRILPACLIQYLDSLVSRVKVVHVISDFLTLQDDR
jgi:hypothetical protein